MAHKRHVPAMEWRQPGAQGASRCYPRKTFMRRFGFCLVICMLVSCSRSTTWSGRIVGKTERSFRSFLNPHVGFQNVLIVDGKRFENVRGIETFYIEVPQLDAILFVVDEKDYSVTYHLYKMDKREDIKIH